MTGLRHLDRNAGIGRVDGLRAAGRAGGSTVQVSSDSVQQQQPAARQRGRQRVLE